MGDYGSDGCGWIFIILLIILICGCGHGGFCGLEE